MSSVGRFFSRSLRHSFACVRAAVTSPRLAVLDLAGMPARIRGAKYADGWSLGKDGERSEPAAEDNPLRTYFDGLTSGPGVWKWLHYFPIYHTHLRRFVGRKVTVTEVGVYSGGSLPMWHQYFGPGCTVHGIDIQPECTAYAAPSTIIHIGDQSDRKFWGRFRESVPEVDVLIDDGGHEPEQQAVTLEEMLPHLRPGGVYICEDIHGINNEFAQYVRGLAGRLNAARFEDYAGNLSTPTTLFQSAIWSVHLYPFVVVIEKHPSPLPRLLTEKHGTQWQPFL
jgi:hypothetical protein